MALSNWDTLAIDGEGRVRHLTSPLGVRLEIYKNWLYVKDEQAWRPGGGYTAPTVMEIYHGDLSYMDLWLHARLGPQNGVYVIAGHGSRHRPEPQRMMIGCGVSGYEESSDDRSASHGLDEYVPPAWVGVKPESVTFLRELAAEILGEDHALTREHPLLRDEVWANAVQFNQGDLFFAANVPTLGLRTSAPGEAQAPIMEQLTNPPVPDDTDRRVKDDQELT